MDIAANSRTSFAEALHDLSNIFASWAIPEQEEILEAEQRQQQRLRQTERGFTGQKVEWAAKRKQAQPQRKMC